MNSDIPDNVIELHPMQTKYGPIPNDEGYVVLELGAGSQGVRNGDFEYVTRERDDALQVLANLRDADSEEEIARAYEELQAILEGAGI